MLSDNEEPYDLDGSEYTGRCRAPPELPAAAAAAARVGAAVVAAVVAAAAGATPAGIF